MSQKAAAQVPSSIIISDSKSGEFFYGGNQAWFESNTRAYAGCGPVAAANLLLCLAGKYPHFMKKKLISLPPYNKNKFIDLMNDIYTTMGTLEVPVLKTIYDRCRRDHPFFRKVAPNNGRSISGFTKGVLHYTENLGIFLHAHTLPTAFCSYETGLHFIEEGLAQSGAVVLLTSFNRHPLTLFGGDCGEIKNPYESKSGMKNHFATITGILNDGSNTLLLSTWGRIAAVHYADLYSAWQSRKAIDSALFYFTPADSPDITELDIKNARRMLFKALRQTLIKKAV
ncbi:MAG: hypothetical protein QM697_16185 [Lachnospiraceae bacterium]